MLQLQQEPSLNAWFDGKTMERKLFAEVILVLLWIQKKDCLYLLLKMLETLIPNGITYGPLMNIKKIGARTIAPDKLQGATITLSNFGMITGRYATPIVVPPMVAILGCGRSRESAIARDGQIMTGRILPLSLTFDHRAVTGGEATRFLGAVIKSLAE